MFPQHPIAAAAALHTVPACAAQRPQLGRSVLSRTLAKHGQARALPMLGLAALLSACGGGGDSASDDPPVPRFVNQAVRVVDGPIKSALVCLDANRNGACDAGESSGTTDADGNVTLSVPGDDAGKHPVLALVGTDAFDADSGAVPVAYSMRAPADKPALVSPLTTLVLVQTEATGASTDEAAAALADRLRLKTSLWADYTTANDDDAKLAGQIARLVVAATQQQLAATANALDKNGNALSATDRAMVIQQGLLSQVEALGRAAADAAITSAATPLAKTEAIAAAATALNAQTGITKDTVAAAVAVAKLPPGTETTSGTGVAGATLRWFSYTDAQNYTYRQFKATAAQNTTVDGKRQFTEYRELSRGSAGQITGFQQWGDGLNNWARNQVVWTGSAWFDCPTDMVHEYKPWDTKGVSSSLYCKAYQSTTRRSERDISGMTMADLVREIRAYPLVDTEGSFSAWGPDPAVHADKLSVVFPSGAVLYYYAAADTAQPDRYNTTLNSDLYLPYVSAVAQGVKSECDKVTGSNFAQYLVPASTLEHLVAASPGKPCIFQPNAATGDENTWWSQSTISIGDVPDDFISSSGHYRSGVKNLRVSFADGNRADYWLCLRRASDGSARNCTAAGSGTYRIDTLGDGRVLRLAGEPQVAGRLGYVRTMVERGGKVWFGSRGRLTTSRQLRLNHVASDALFGALGMPAPRASAPLTATSLLASYMGTAGPGTVNRNALAKMENSNTGLTGAWALGSAGDPQAQVFFFFANGDYVMADPQGDTSPSRCGGAGMERGTYRFDTSSGTLQVLSNSVDTNGCAGLHDPTSNAPLGIVTGMRLSPDGQRLTVTWDDGSGVDTLFRLSN